MGKFASFDDFLALFHGVTGSGNQRNAHCPCTARHAHNDATASLRIKLDGEKILVHCNTGCTVEDVCSAIGCTTADLFLSGTGGTGAGMRSPDAYIRWFSGVNRWTDPVIYQYGNGVYKVRFATGKKNEPKVFRWIHADPTSPSGYTSGRGDGYRHTLYFAGDPGADIINIVEGEKDADTLHTLTGETAACTENGASARDTAGKWHAEYNDQLRGKTVYLFHDNDSVGKKFAKVERAHILTVAARLYEINLEDVWPEIPEHGDISDMLAEKGPEETRRLLDQLKQNAQEQTPAPGSAATPPARSDAAPAPEAPAARSEGKPGSPAAAPAPAPAAGSDWPAWVNVNGSINELDFVRYMAEKTGWKKAGRITRDSNGQIVTADAVKAAIAAEIALFCPTDTARKANSLFRLLMVCLPEAKNANKLEIISAHDLAAADIQKPAFTINQLLPVGLAVLAAAPKIGKSWLCLAMADAITTGSKFFGFDVCAGACLYMALEDSPFRIRERLAKIGSSMPDNLQIATTGARRLDDGLLLQLESWITNTENARLIIIDTLARVKPLSTGGLDAYSADTATIAPLQALAIEKGVTVVLVTHYSKTKQFTTDSDPYNRIMGSNGLFGVADTTWIICGDRGAESMTLRTTGRDSLNNEFSITFNKETCRWQLLGTSEALEEQKRLDAYKTSPLAQTIVELVNAGGRWQGSATELMQEVATRKAVYAGDVREIGQKVAEMAEYLLQLDGITVAKNNGGRRGRGYTFERVRKLV